ncbi:MAG: FHA domain-containing protein [Thermodesulfobacteriota bacterium]
MKKRNIEDTILFDHKDLDFIKEEKIEVESDLIYSGKGKGSFVVFITGPDKGNVIPINKEKMIIGRDSESDIVINKKFVSKKHAKIVTVDNNAEVYDFGSTNGTYVNDTKIQRVDLKDRDEIRIGDIVIKYFRIDLNDGSLVQPALMDIDKTYTEFYNLAVKELKPYFGQMTDRFLNRQISAHVGKSPYTISVSDKKDLAKWVRISAGLLLDEETAARLAEKILALK